MNSKKKIIVGSSVAAVAVLALGAFAYFSDKSDTSTTGTVGTVDVDVTDLDLKHYYNGEEVSYNNMNPGDNDPDEEDNDRPGTDHELSFNVSNTGTKSIMTRTVITVTATDKDGNDITAKDLINVILSEKASSTALGDTVQDTSTITKLAPDNYEETDTKLNYVIGGTRDEDVLSGTSANAEEEVLADGVTIAPTNISKTFDIGLENTVTSESPLVGATITFNIEVQAMQYRNTADSDWTTMFERTVTMDAGN